MERVDKITNYEIIICLQPLELGILFGTVWLHTQEKNHLSRIILEMIRISPRFTNRSSSIFSHWHSFDPNNNFSFFITWLLRPPSHSICVKVIFCRDISSNIDNKAICIIFRYDFWLWQLWNIEFCIFVDSNGIFFSMTIGFISFTLADWAFYRRTADWFPRFDMFERLVNWVCTILCKRLWGYRWRQLCLKLGSSFAKNKNLMLFIKINLTLRSMI